MQKANGELVPGGLAMIIGISPEHLNGSIVLLNNLFSDGDCVDGLYRFRGASSWKCESERLSAKTSDGERTISGFGFIQPRNLMPINPEADPLHVSELEKCTND